jgi:hypothetical protein
MTDWKGGDHRRDPRQEKWRHTESQAENRAVGDELDAALRRYAAVEPRPGFEERLLANLRTGQKRAPVGIGWRWPWAGAVAVVVLVLVFSLAWRTSKQHLSKATDPRITPDGRDTQVAKRASRPYLPSVHPTARQRPRPSTVRIAPHLEQFPSPQPLSEQEKILAGYVAAYPEHAALVAEARAEALRRDAAEEMRDPAGEPKLQP